jgi:ketosteroid isomerase-like protein
MPKTMIPALTAAALGALTFPCAQGVAQQKPRPANDVQSATEQVWAGEEAYWRDVKAHDVEHYLSLWSEDFMGWPIVDEHPAGKGSLRAVVEGPGASLGNVIAYSLQRESVRQHGPVVITYYRVTETRRVANGSDVTTTYRLSHTWLRQRDGWKIVGGMSCVDPPAKDETGQ